MVSRTSLIRQMGEIMNRCGECDKADKDNVVESMIYCKKHKKFVGIHAMCQCGDCKCDK